MPTANYAVVANGVDGVNNLQISNKTVNGFRITVYGWDNLDPQDIGIQFAVFATNAQLPDTVTQEELDAALSTWKREGTVLRPQTAGDSIDNVGTITASGVYTNTRFTTSASVNTYINLDDGNKYGLAIRDLSNTILIGLNANGKIRTTGGIESPIIAGQYAYALGEFDTASGGLFLEADAAGSLYLSPGSGESASINLYGASGNAVFSGTVTANGNVLTLSSGNLDVGDKLSKAVTALTTIKAAASDSYTDLAGLKAAIVSALANF